jgi:hypothetical protein
MRKLFLLALACVVWIGAWPRPASAACGQAKVSNDVVARQASTALLQGILEELPLVRCPRPAGWVLHANGQRFYVDFGPPDAKMSAKLLAEARKLQGKLVEIGGTLEHTGKTEWIDGPRVPPNPMPNQVPSLVRILHVWSLTALGDPEGTPVEIVGELTYVELQSYPPIQVWMLKTANKTYSLRFNSAALFDQVKRLRHGSVTVIGKLGKSDTITVTGLVNGATLRIKLPSYPEEIPPCIFKPIVEK